MEDAVVVLVVVAVVVVDGIKNFDKEDAILMLCQFQKITSNAGRWGVGG